jgi:hypothetical protein
MALGYHPPLAPPVKGGGFPKASPQAGEGRVRGNSQSISCPYFDAYGEWRDVRLQLKATWYQHAAPKAPVEPVLAVIPANAGIRDFQEVLHQVSAPRFLSYDCQLIEGTPTCIGENKKSPAVTPDF